MPNFVTIDQSVAEILRFFEFFKMAAVRHLGFVWGIFGPPAVSIWGVSITLQNLVMIDAVVFINRLRIDVHDDDDDNDNDNA